MSNDKKWITLARAIVGPKLRWLTTELSKQGVSHIAIEGPIGRVVQVPLDEFETAHDIYFAEIGTMNVPIAALTWADLDDNHAIFGGGVPYGMAEFVKPTSAGIEIDWPDAESGTIKIELLDCNSSLLSALGFHQAKNGLYVVARFKGKDTLYRYYLLDADLEFRLTSIIEAQANGDTNASVGKAFNQYVKALAEDGKIFCEKLETGKWLDVPAKANRPKRAVKATAKDVEVLPPTEAPSEAPKAGMTSMADALANAKVITPKVAAPTIGAEPEKPMDPVLAKALADEERYNAMIASGEIRGPVPVEAPPTPEIIAGEIDEADEELGADFFANF